jgi:WD40 repeat protein
LTKFKFNEVKTYYIIIHFILLNDSQDKKNDVINEKNVSPNNNDNNDNNNANDNNNVNDKNIDNDNNNVNDKNIDNDNENKNEIESDNELSFESVSSIKKSKSNNSSSSSPLTENKNMINNSAISQNKKTESKNSLQELSNKSLNITSTNLNSLPEIPKLLNHSINNSYYPTLNMNMKNPMNKYLLFLKSKYNFIKPYTSKGFDSKKINFQNELIELQKFKADSEQIWVASLDNFHNYLATGGKSGVLKIWKINTLQDDNNKYNNPLLLFSNNKEDKEFKTDEEVKNYLNIIDETVYKIFCEHTLDIIDIAWSKKYKNLLVSVSLDQKAVLYDITQNSALKIFVHKNAITSISFYPDKLLLLNIFLNEKSRLSCFLDEKKNNINISAPQKNDDYFITCCFNLKVYLWNIYNDKEPFYCIHVNEIITKALFFPDGSNLCLGSIKGNIFIYEVIENFRYSYSFHVRNKKGKGAMNKKITDIQFLTKNQILVTTNDNRIRILNINDGSVIQKFRGHKNTEGILKCAYCENYEIIISPSEDKYIYLWNIKKKKKKVEKQEKIEKKLNQKVHNYEYFKPKYSERKEYCTQCLFIEGQNLINYNHKLYNNELFIYIKNIILFTTNKGNIQIILDYNDLEDK